MRLARLDWLTLVSGLRVADEVAFRFAVEPVVAPVALELRSVPVAVEGVLPVRLPVVAPEVAEVEPAAEERSPGLRLLPVVLPALFVRSPEVTPEPVLVELALAPVFVLSVEDPDDERVPDIEPEGVLDEPEVELLLVLPVPADEPVLVEPLAPEPVAPLPEPAEPDD